MELFIQIRDGQPHEHPIFGDNFRQAFPDIDVNNLPPEFARFERVPQPNTAGTFEVEELSYQWIDGIVKDVWSVRPMTEIEHAQKLQDLTQAANASVGFLKEITQQNIDNAPSDAAKQAWIDYLAALNAWTLVDPVEPNIPQPPRINADGTVMDVNAPGSAPNVIG